MVEQMTESERVLGDIAAERRRQIEAEGWSPEHDDKHEGGSLAVAAACYAAPEHVKWTAPSEERQGVPLGYWNVLRWPWDDNWWKPKSRRQDLIRAAALIVAEIERIDRAALRTVESDRDER